MKYSKDESMSKTGPLDLDPKFQSDKLSLTLGKGFSTESEG